MKTIVLQTFRTENIPAWMARCLASVRAWSLARGYDYDFRGDEIFAYCGPDYLTAVGDNKRSITNLARLEWIKAAMAAGYDRAIWLDADTFIFDPKNFEMNVTEGYACGREVWLGLTRAGLYIHFGVHNAALVFAGPHADLDHMITLIRHIAATRPVRESFQVGVRLLTGLHAGLQFPLMPQIGLFSPELVRAIARNQIHLLRLFARHTIYPVRAANLCWSRDAEYRPEDLDRAMDRLEQSAGAVINRHLDPKISAPLLIPDYGTANIPQITLRYPLQLALHLVPAAARLKTLYDAAIRRRPNS
jgi:hypothetical protein